MTPFLGHISDDMFVHLYGRETRHAFGRTALVLSGGGSFGAFHLGVVKVGWTMDPCGFPKLETRLFTSSI